MFCAAVPTVLAVGTARQGRQRAERQAAEARGETPKPPLLPAGKVTGAAVMVLVVAAVINHTHPGGLV
ncbi:MAG TPA: hypothetical protein VGA61_08840 [Anaerolineae bacterium]